MAQLNSIVRALIRVALGTALNPGSYPEALDAYLRAAEIDSKRLIHRHALELCGVSFLLIQSMYIVCCCYSWLD